MGRIRALPLIGAVLAAAVLISGASGADPHTPPALPGHPTPFLGTSVIGDGGLLAAVDDYGDVVDLRAPGPAGEARIDNPFARQAAGSVPSHTGIVPAAGAGRHEPRPLWRASAVRQHYLPATNVLVTRAAIAGADLRIVDAARGERLARHFVVQGRSRQLLRLRIDVHLLRSGGLSCHARPGASSAGHRLSWRGRGELSASLSCGLSTPGFGTARVISNAAQADRSWLAKRLPLAPVAPGWAQRAYARSLLVLRALTDRRSGAVAAAARDHWAYVWPRDAGTVAIALAESGYVREARRVARFLSRLDLGAGARFQGSGAPVDDGRILPGDSAGWASAAATAAGIHSRPPRPGGWRNRGDYGERDDDRGDYLANAIAGAAGSAEIKQLFAGTGGLQRRAGDGSSGLDSAVAWAVQPFPHPTLYRLVRRSLLSLASRANRYGLPPSQDWPRNESWTAPAAWSAWSLATLGDRRAALRLLAAVRRATTPTGTIPERVGLNSGLPRSATPLGWSHAFSILALRQLYARR
jgi:glucoamylase